jgi:hypothetical protein
MTTKQLIQLLRKHPPTAQVMILDGFNGGGAPRDLNLGPALQAISSEDADATADCEQRIGEKVVVLGYGCY